MGRDRTCPLSPGITITPIVKCQWYEARRQQFLYHSTRLSTDKSDRRNRPNIKNSTRWQNVAISMAKSRLLFHSYRRLS